MVTISPGGVTSNVAETTPSARSVATPMNWTLVSTPPMNTGPLLPPEPVGHVGFSPNAPGQRQLG